MLYELTLGIPDLAIKVFMLSQYRAIALGKEEIDVEVIRSVVLDSFRSINGMLAAVRRGDLKELQEIGDIILLEDTAILAEWQRRLQKGQRIGTTKASENGRSSGGEEVPPLEEQPGGEKAPTQIIETHNREQVASIESTEQIAIKQEERNEEEVRPEKASTISKREKTKCDSSSSPTEATVVSKAPVEKVGLLAALQRARAKKIPGYQAMAEAGYARQYRSFYPELQQPKRVP